MYKYNKPGLYVNIRNRRNIPINYILPYIGDYN